MRNGQVAGTGDDHARTEAGRPGAIPDVTDLLLRWNAGDGQALEELTPFVYNDLRRLAGAVLTREGPGHTLSATALVHEVYLRLVDQRRARWVDRAQFFSAAAHIMRRVLVDHARAKSAAKRGGGAVRVALDEGDAIVNAFAEEIVDLDGALTRLGALDVRKMRIVEMKCLAGMTNEEIADALGVSGATVERDWKFARAWLIEALRGPVPVDAR